MQLEHGSRDQLCRVQNTCTSWRREWCGYLSSKCTSYPVNDALNSVLCISTFFTTFLFSGFKSNSSNMLNIMKNNRDMGGTAEHLQFR